MKDHIEPDSLADSEFRTLLVACLEKLERGESLNRDTLLREHSQYAKPLAAFLDDQEMLMRIASGIRDAACGDANPANQPTMDSVFKKPEFELGDSVRYIGEYEILAEIARGGMGIVFKARQQSLNRIVALKMILAGRLADPSEVERFRREARAAGRLNHPSIVPIFEIGEYEGRHYFTMEFVDGPSLAEIIRQETLAPRTAATLLRDVAEAVQYAHQQGTVHRDLKPGNVLLKGKTCPRITDFGLAKLLESVDEASRAELTASGQILGTPSYMSPEQAAGKQALVGPAADIYSLGAILYACLTGRAPFVADSPVDTLMQVLNKDPVAPRTLNPSVPRDLETICFKCLNKEPHRRYGTAQELADDLRRFDERRPVLARPISGPAKVQRWTRRNPLVASLVTLAVILLVGGTVVSSYFAVKAERRADAETVQRERADREAEAAEAARREMQNALVLEESARADAEAAHDEQAKARRLAEQALAGETLARRQADHAARAAQWESYVAKLQPLRQASMEKEWGHLDRLLGEMIPAKNQPDYRGWEWYFFQDQVHAITSKLGETERTAGNFILDAPRDRLFAWTGGKLKIWSLGTKTIEKVLSIPPLHVETVSLSPNGKYLVGGDWTPKRGLVWDVDADKLLMELQVEPNEKGPETGSKKGPTLWATAWNPDGSQWATASRDGEIRIWKTSDWSLDKVLQQRSHRNTIGNMDWNAHSGLATGHRFGWFRIWDVDAGKVLHTAKCGNSILECVKWNPSGTRLALATEGLDVFTNEAKRVSERLQAGLTTAVAWLDDEILAAGGRDQDVRVCSSKNLADFKRLRVHSGQIRSLAFLDDQVIISGADDEGIRLTRLDVEHPAIQKFQAHQDRATEVEWSPDGTQLATSGWDGHVCVWDAGTLSLMTKVGESHTWVWDVAWDNAGDRLASIEHRGRLDIWNADEGTLIEQLQVANLDHPRLDWRPANDFLILGGRRSQIISTSPLKSIWTDDSTNRGWRIEYQIGPNQKRAAGIGENGRFVVIDLEQRKVIKDLYLGDTGTGAGAWSPDGTRFVAAGTDMSIIDMNSLERIDRLEGHRGAVGGVCFNPTGTRIASSGNNGMVYFWDVKTGDLLVRIPLTDGALGAIDWSPNGHRLATVNSQGELIVMGTPTLDDHHDKLDVLSDYVMTPEEELTLLSQAIRGKPDNGECWQKRGLWFATHQRWSEASSDLQQATQASPGSSWYRCEAATAAWMAGDRKAYTDQVQANLDKLPKYDFSSETVTGAYLAQTAALDETFANDFESLLPLAERFAQKNPSSIYCQRSLILLTYRLGNYEQVLERLQPHLDRRAYGNMQIYEQIFVDCLQALALQHLGEDTEARHALSKAEATAAQAWPNPMDKTRVIEAGLRIVPVKALLAEAKKLIHHAD